MLMPIRMELTAAMLYVYKNSAYPYVVDWLWGPSLEKDQRIEVKEWAYQQYGPQGFRWSLSLTSGTIKFRDEVDAMMFLLKWA